MAIDSPTNVLIEIHSVTGALVSSFRNNTLSGENLVVECNELKNGGLDTFSFTVPTTTSEPLFNDMECQIHIDGVHWFSGYAEYIPERDTNEAVIEIAGKGFVHKLKEKTINRSYASQTLDYIIKDVANLDLGSEINVFYDVLKITVPAITGITIEFKDKTLFQVFSKLNTIANKDYLTTQYTWGVDNEKELYFSAISNDLQKHYFEGYNYQNPSVEKMSNKLVNKILTYRTTSLDPQVIEYVATYEDTGSQGLYGLFERKITFPDYADTTTIANIANGILEKNADPVNRLEIENLQVTEKLDIGFYALSNRRDHYFLSVNEFEDIAEWTTTYMLNSVPTIDTAEVFTGRKALKVVTSAGCKDDYMELVLDEPIRFPNIFRMFVYLDDADADITVRLIDSNNNSVDLNFGDVGDLSGEWIKSLSLVSMALDTEELTVDYDITTEWDLIMDMEAGALDYWSEYYFTPEYWAVKYFPGFNSDEASSAFDIVALDTLIREGILDLTTIRIIINNDTASVFYIDSMNVEANTYLYRNIIAEEIKYKFDKSYLADLVLGSKTDSLIDEIDSSVKDGNIALEVFSKQ